MRVRVRESRLCGNSQQWPGNRNTSQVANFSARIKLITCQPCDLVGLCLSGSTLRL